MIRRFFRWLLRAIVTLVIIFVLMLVSDYIQHRVETGSVLVVTLKGPVVERATPGLLGLASQRETPLTTLRSAIDRAAEDPRIAGLAIKVIDPDMELGQAQEIIGLVKGFRKHGKWACAYIETAGEFSSGNLPYIVAASTGDVSIMPDGELNVVGVGIREVFARGTLDWIGIRPNFGAFGKYKSAGNIFTEKDFTPAQREEDESLIGSMYDQIVAAISSERGLGTDKIHELINQAPLSAGDGLKAKLVDRIEYEDQFTDRMKNQGGTKHAMVDFTDYARPRMLSSWGVKDRIAVIYCDGEIQRGEGEGVGLTGTEVVTSDDLSDAFDKAREDESVRAIIFRINSPGGSALGSELIRRAAELTSDKKPIVVSMSGYAASGGYWVSTPAAKMIAEPGTITGSIGVLGGKFNVEPATKKIHLNSGAITRGDNVEMFDEFADFTPDQMKIFQDRMLGDTYQHFLRIVAKSRHMSVEDVDAIAQGRVWTGEQALTVKLVDTLGGFETALGEARKLAKLTPEQKVTFMELPPRPGLLSRILGSQATSAVIRMPATMRA
ncbi:MAG TPA: signal peptide peptidase SppA, partial [Candidatus Binataceae bacterium]|nr:signal peptide peptidase SppA [Candidatus Binataceae bacterium]